MNVVHLFMTAFHDKRLKVCIASFEDLCSSGDQVPSVMYDDL